MCFSLLQMFQCATASSTGGARVDDRLTVVGQVMSTIPSALRAKLTKKLSELAEARQNAVSKKAGFKSIDTIVVGGTKGKAGGKGDAGMALCYCDVSSMPYGMDAELLCANTTGAVCRQER